MSRWLIVGVPGDRRVEAFVAATRRRGLPTPLVVPWLEVNADPRALTTRVRPHDRVRIESPGSDAATWHALSVRGGSNAPFDADMTRWRPARAWFAGLTSTLRALSSATVDGASMQGVEGILAMTDKAIARSRLAAAGVRIPDGELAPSTPHALRELLLARRWSQVFVKPRWGSSGAGVIALRRAALTIDAREQLTTTLRSDGDLLVQCKRLSSYRERAAIDAVLRPILADGAIVERWIPKLGTARGPFDLRVVTIGGVVRHRTARVGRGPITNLHLDAARLDVDAALARAPRRTHDELNAICTNAAAAFGDCLYAGIDVAIDPTYRPWVLEINAWGDYLPRLTDGGVDTYEAELAAAC